MTVTKSFADLPRVRIAYSARENTGAPTVMLAHSLFMDSGMFDTLAERLATEYTVIAYDARGHGDSGIPSDGRYDMDAFSDDAAALIEALGCGPVHFAGNSMGGFAALRLAARRPDLVRSASAMGSSGDAEYQIEEFGGIVAHLRQHGGNGIEGALMHVFFGDDTLADPAFEPLRATWLDRFARLPREMAEPAAGVVYRSAILPELPRSPTPILAIAGAQDHAYSVALSERIAGAAPRGQLAVVEGAGHSLAMENPQAVHALLRSFFASAQ